MNPYDVEALKQLDITELKSILVIIQNILTENDRVENPPVQEQPIKIIKKYNLICCICHSIFGSNNSRLKYCEECYGLSPIKICITCNHSFKSYNQKEKLCRSCYMTKLQGKK